MDVKEVLRKAVEEHASDIFIIAGLPISYRSNNVIIKEEGERLMPPETENYLEQIYELADHRDIDRLLKHGDDDFSFAVKGLSRYRVSTYMQRGSMAAVIRIITFDLPEDVYKRQLLHCSSTAPFGVPEILLLPAPVFLLFQKIFALLLFPELKLHLPHLQHR